MKRILVLCFAAMLAGQVCAFTVNGLVYTVIEGTNTVSVAKGSTAPTNELLIPSSVKNNGTTYTVTIIGNSAFYNCIGLTSVDIPNSVTSIGEEAFRGCNSLTSISIPNSVTSIGWAAFWGCSSLTSIIIPNSVTSIDNQAFYDCSKLTDINVEDGNSDYSSEDGVLFNYDKTTLIWFPAAKTESSYNISNSVTSIGIYAFNDCNNLISVTIPNSVTSIEGGAFYNCSGLTSITIPNSVTSIGRSAFSGCNGLISVTIGNSVTSIGENAFYGCSGLSSVTIPNSVTSIEGGAFFYCTGLTSVTIGNSVTSIGNNAFYGCSRLTSVSIPNSVTTIEGGAFTNCSGLTSITIPNSVTSIDDCTFSNCSGLTTVTIPESVTSIDNYAFYGCSGLSSVTIPNSVAKIGTGAFSGCTGLTSITLPFVGDKPHERNDTYQYPFGYIFGTESYDGGTETTQYYYGSSTSSTTSSKYYIPSSLKSVTITGSSYIPCGAFYNCSGLTSVFIPNSITSIGFAAFEGCSGMTSIIIPNSVTSIGGSAFNGCSSLTSITIPNSVASIGRSAFYGCSGLTSITIPNSVTSIGEGAFWACRGLTSITIPNSVTSIAERTFYGCSSLTSVTIPNSVTSIGDYAFLNCEGLKSVIIGNSVASIGEGVFNICVNLVEINVESTNASYLSENGVLFNKDKTTIVRYPSGKTETTYTIPDGVTSIGTYAFNRCSVLTSITIPNTVTSISNNAFNGCSGLTSITIPNSVTSIGSNAFNRCGNLTSITLPFVGDKPHEPTDTYQYPFGYIFGTGSYEGGTATTQYYYYKSTSSTTHTSYFIPSSLKSVTITGSSYIPYGAFYNCTGLTSIIIPNSVSSIVNCAFQNCSGLTSIAYDGTSEPTIGTDAFINVDSSVKVCVPDNYSSDSFGEFDIYKGHNNVTDQSVSPTCTETGLAEGVHCANCGRVFVAQEEIPALGHNYGTPTYEWGEGNSTCTATKICANDSEHVVIETANATSAVTVAAACEAVGTRTFTAEFTDEDFATQQTTEVIPATGHKEVVDAAVAATCTAAGKTEGKHCEVCNAVLVAQENIPAIGHDFKTYKFDNNATTEADGTETALCEHGCGTTDTRTAAGTKIATTPEKGTAVAESAANNVNIYTKNNIIVVENATAEIRVYDAMGRMICRDAINRVRAEIPVNTPGVYIIRAGNVTKRVMINN